MPLSIKHVLNKPTASILALSLAGFMLASCGDSEEQVISKTFAINKNNCAELEPKGLGDMFKSLVISPADSYINNIKDDKKKEIINNFKNSNAEQFNLTAYTFVEGCKLLKRGASEKEATEKAAVTAKEIVAANKKAALQEEKNKQWFKEDQAELAKLQAEDPKKIINYFVLPAANQYNCRDAYSSMTINSNVIRYSKERQEKFEQRCSELGFEINQADKENFLKKNNR